MPKVTPRGGGEAVRPEFVEFGDVPELFCETIIGQTFGETTRLYLGRTLTPGGKAEVTCIVHMPAGGFESALRLLCAKFLPKPDGH